jgi:hypothetical protein
VSIISDALKKAEAFRREAVYPDARQQSVPMRVAGVYRNIFRLGLLCLVVLAFGVLFTSAYVVVAQTREMNQKVARVLVPSSDVRVSPRAQRDEAGSSRFDLEEKPFHQIGSFSAQPGDPLFVLSGIARNEDEYLAVVNDQILRKGDQIEGAVVIDITMDYVELQLNQDRIFLEKSY